jgi:glycosyltransferase involved in cell wall biosynthesis
MQINPKLTTITITYNNVIGLDKTLKSIFCSECKPFEIIVVDGGSTDGSIELIESYKEKLPQLNFSSQNDDGIYDALNIGKRRVRTPLVHYLNAGDVLYGNAYEDINDPCLLPVVFIDEKGIECGTDRVKLMGTSYNHQGIVVYTEHREFDLRYSIASDYKMLLQEFPGGLRALKVLNSGGVKYLLGGVSSQKTLEACVQLIKIIFEERPFSGLPIIFILLLKSLVPRIFRRWILKRL